MKILSYIIFFLVFLSVFGLSNYYIFIRGWQALPKITPLKITYLIIFLILALSFIAGMIIERMDICLASEAFIWIGSIWLGYMAYLFFGALLIDILRGLNHFLHFFPDIIIRNYEKAKLITAAGVFSLSTIIIIAGFINARTPVIRHLEFNIPKKAGNITSLKIAAASDIHLGTINSNSRIEKLVNRINQLEPDIILLPGDIVDGDIKPVIENDLGKILSQFRSKYGVFASTGNHEYIGGADQSIKYLEDHSITMLRDKAVLIDESFYVAGREDQSVSRFNGKNRKSIEELTKDINCSLPVILMDHQPFGLKKAAETDCVDIQISGHTHHGQLWPFNFITKAMYEKSAGYTKIKNTHFYVSSGFGTWGPPIRTNSRSEILDITLRFIQ